MKRAQDELRDKLNRCPAQIPEGDAEAASAGTSAHPEGVVKDPRVRRAQGHHGACERLGHRQGPRVLGRRRGVQAGAVRVRRSRLQGHGLGVRALWCGEKDMPRNRVRLGHHGARARGSALPLRLGAHGRADAGRAPHDRGDGHHRSEEGTTCICIPSSARRLSQHSIQPNHDRIIQTSRRTCISMANLLGLGWITTATWLSATVAEPSWDWMGCLNNKARFRWDALFSA
jgi:hypothetical protein